MYKKYEKVKEILKENKQEHLLIWYDKLIEQKREQLLDRILTIDFEQINELYKQAKQKKDFKECKVEPLSYIDKEKLSKEDKEKYEAEGKKEIAEGKYAVVTMAGGQGTRLGHNGPKGTFELEVGEKKPLFTLLAQTIKEANKKYNVTIPWYIMTSRENNYKTTDFFKRHDYFGMGEENIKFFIQNELPMVDVKGKILVDEAGMIKDAADGHGGIFEAMNKDGIIKDMKKRGIKWIFIAGVDNVLAKMVDPILTGLAIENKCLAAGKSVVKSNPKERVGVFCKKDNRPSVIEYTEITDEMAEARDENGELLYGESHILCNLFNIKAIEEIAKNKLPYHSAFKKAKYIDKNGVIVVPEVPNAYKFEAFIFDAFERLDDMAIMRVKREEEFAPVKNAEGVDSPETAAKLYLDYIKNKK
ncbi:MAG: UDPGP type 1 family protein [Clostridia bacterium]|nr:UDPGP type 1 family protein [Clostridia bacterium]